MNELHILNLGCGWQSTALYLMYAEGVITPNIRCAIFADTQDEPKAVYRHLEWLQSLGGPEIMVRTAGRLGDYLLTGLNSTGQRFISIPAFTMPKQVDQVYRDASAEFSLEYGEPVMVDMTVPERGMIRRQCTSEFKIKVIERAIRYEILGLNPGERIPADTIVRNVVGISLDEAERAWRMRNKETSRVKFRFPLIEQEMTLEDCGRYNIGRVPHEVPRSACTFCPFHDDNEWLAVKAVREDWERAVEIDEALRRQGNMCNRNMDQALFLHSSCTPLKDVVFKPQLRKTSVQKELGFSGCLGACGV